MKTATTLLRLTLLSLIGLSRIHAQTVSQVIIFKGTELVQTSAAGAVVNPLGQGPSYGGPFNFRVSVAGPDGVDMSGLTPTPQITLAAGSLYPTQNSVGHNNGFLTYDSNNNEWRYGANHNDYGGPTEAGRDASFAFGDYGMSVQTASFTLHFPQADSQHPNIAPTVTLTGGSWVAGRYVVNVNQALTITTNAFPNFSQAPDAAMDLQVQDQDGPDTTFYSADHSAPNFLTYTIPAGTLTADRDYRGHASFYSIMDKQTAVTGLPGALTAAVYEMSTGFVISTISTPNPNASATLYRVGHLGDLSGVENSYSEVRDVTKVGGVIYAVGNSIAYVRTPNQPSTFVSDTGFLWTSTNGLTALPNKVDTFTPDPPFVTASAITANAVYIAGRTRAGSGGNEIHANRITVSGLVNLDVGTAPGFPTLNAAAVSISSNGSVMYGFSKYGATPKSKAVRITTSPSVTVTEIPFLNPGDDRSFMISRGISSDGTVALGTSVNTTVPGNNISDHVGNQAFRYVYPAGTVTGIPFLGGGTWNGALALSSDGNLALVTGNSTAYSGGEVYLYNVTGATSTSLGAPSGQNTPSNSGAMNSDGSLVVLSWGNGPNLCFLRNGSGWHSLTTIMTSAGLNLTNWTINNINGMSPDGTLIWGVGTHNGVAEGWIVEFNAGYLAAYGAAPHDFSSDGKSDLVWQNTVTGDRSIWLMNGSAFAAGAFIGTIATDWKIVGTTDFNADGKADLLWENTVTGDHSIWLMNGPTFMAGGYLGQIPTEWKVASAADFNGDGKADLLWENTVTGDHTIWLMDGATFLAGGYLGQIPTDWSVACTGDLNGDGKADLVWQNKVTGERTVWLMNGTAFLAGGSLGTIPTAWKIVAVADFNGDGKADLVWENATTGDHTIWLMNGTTFLSGAVVGAADPHWLIESTGDYNGDGKADLVWKNIVTGERSIWLMNGTTFVSGASIGVIGTDWSIAK